MSHYRAFKPPGVYTNESRKLAPSVKEYENYIAEHQKKNPTARISISAGKLRQIVMLRRAGDDWAEINRSLNLKGSQTVKSNYERLPDYLK